MMRPPRFLRVVLFEVEDPIRARAEENPLHVAFRAHKSKRNRFSLSRSETEWRMFWRKFLGLKDAEVILPA